jgi:hypothetical protein
MGIADMHSIGDGIAGVWKAGIVGTCIPGICAMGDVGII